MAKRLTAKPVIEEIKSSLTEQTAAFLERTRRKPKLAVVIVGEDPASKIYVQKKAEAAKRLGFESETIHFVESTDPKKVLKMIDYLNQDPKTDGILIQRPLPPQFEESQVLSWVSPGKDVDGFHPYNVGSLALGFPQLVSCTPLGIIRLLEFYNFKFEGKTACVVGRSSIVGKPIAQLLLQKNMTLIHCHRKSQPLSTFTKQADLLVAAAGQPKLIQKEDVKPGATVVDVGIHRLKDGTLCGDVDEELVSQQAAAITPVPGGIGPMTIHLLLENTLKAALKNEDEK